MSLLFLSIFNSYVIVGVKTFGLGLQEKEKRRRHNKRVVVMFNSINAGLDLLTLYMDNCFHCATATGILYEIAIKHKSLA